MAGYNISIEFHWTFPFIAIGIIKWCARREAINHI